MENDGSITLFLFDSKARYIRHRLKSRKMTYLKPFKGNQNNFLLKKKFISAQTLILSNNHQLKSRFK